MMTFEFQPSSIAGQKPIVNWEYGYAVQSSDYNTQSIELFSWKEFVAIRVSFVKIRADHLFWNF
jgi:hypothetical protein